MIQVIHLKRCRFREFSDKVFEVYMAQKKKWQRINWRDPFLLEEQLAGDQKMVRDSAKQFAHDRL